MELLKTYPKPSNSIGRVKKYGEIYKWVYCWKQEDYVRGIKKLKQNIEDRLATINFEK